jgi:hypothetical protein
MGLWSLYAMREPAAVFYGCGERASRWAQRSHSPQRATGYVAGQRRATHSLAEAGGLAARSSCVRPNAYVRVVLDGWRSPQPVLGVLLMKKTLLTGIAALSLATGTAHSQEQVVSRDNPIARYSMTMPPPEYDHPYPGKLIIDVRSETEVDWWCQFTSTRKPKLTCTLPSAHRDYCHIVTMSDDDMRAFGFDPKVIHRHEIAHCNGWPSDHRGGTRVLFEGVRPRSPKGQT